MKLKTVIILAALGAISIGSYSYADIESNLAQLDRDELREVRRSGNREGIPARLKELKMNRPQLTDEQKETIAELKEVGDKDAIRDQLNEWGIEKPEKDDKGLRKDHVFKNLTEDQKTEIQVLRESGDKEVVREKLTEFGVELPEKRERIALTDEQKETIKELKEKGDKNAVKAYFEEIGLKKPRHNMEKRKEIFESLTDDEKEVLEEARDIARAGDKELAQEMIKELFADDFSVKKTSRGVLGFFKKIFTS